MRPARAGGAAMEFALTLPVLMILLGGVIEWGWFLHREVGVIQAVRDGALAGALTERGADPAAAAVARARVALEQEGLDSAAATLSASTEPATTGTLVRLSAVVPHEALLHLLPVPAQLRAESAFQLVRP